MTQKIPPGKILSYNSYPAQLPFDTLIPGTAIVSYRIIAMEFIGRDGNHFWCKQVIIHGLLIFVIKEGEFRDQG